MSTAVPLTPPPDSERGNKAPPERLISVSQAREIACFPIDSSTVRDWLASGKLSGRRIAGRWFLTAAAAQKLRDGNV
jgi:hypothetical protein